jgi:FAD/FMN-containing dehydrogenase
MKRREFLNQAATATLATAVLGMKGYVVPWGSLLRKAAADTGINLPSLKTALDPKDALMLLPTDAKFAAYQASYNLRVALKPQARIMVQTPRGVTQAVQWLKANKVPFAVRCGGHSYEGFSQSSSVVIDTRLMSVCQLDADSKSVFVGGGSALGEVYAETGKRSLAVPAGTCPTVGVSGHVQGGGFGALSRTFGLACDSIMNVELVDHTGAVLNCNEKENTDLYWALRGGGGGSFGVATKYQFRTHAVGQLQVFGLSWLVPAKRAAAIFKAWQQYIQQAPTSMNCFMRFSGSDAGISIAVVGQSTDSEANLRAELKKFSLEPPTRLNISAHDFAGSVGHFGGRAGYESIYMKGKSDYLYEEMDSDQMTTLFSNLQKHSGIAAMFDGYGGAIKSLAPDATAFVHRKAIASIQWYGQSSQAGIAGRVASMRALHDSTRSCFSGHAYVNYPDLDLKDYAAAYWGDNLVRLKKIKAAADPDNIFRHAQSIPL